MCAGRCAPVHPRGRAAGFGQRKLRGTIQCGLPSRHTCKAQMMPLRSDICDPRHGGGTESIWGRVCGRHSNAKNLAWLSQSHPKGRGSDSPPPTRPGRGLFMPISEPTARLAGADWNIIPHLGRATICSEQGTATRCSDSLGTGTGQPWSFPPRCLLACAVKWSFLRVVI